MSTTFGIFKIPVETDKHGQITSEYSHHDYHEIVYRGNGIRFIHPYGDLYILFKDDTKIYPIDNTAQGIYTIGDVKQEIAKQEVLAKIKQEIK